MLQDKKEPTNINTSNESSTSWLATVRKGYFPHQLSWLIDNPVRRLLLSPEKFADRFPISKSSHILEIGPGPGYFSLELANRIPDGQLELFDLQPEMLAKVKSKMEKAVIKNVSYTTGDASKSFSFADNSFDIAVLITVLREIPDKAACLAEIYRVLRPAGLAVFHEQIPDNLIPPNELGSLLASAGFEFVERKGPAWNYTAIFRKSAVGQH